MPQKGLKKSKNKLNFLKLKSTDIKKAPKGAFFRW